jgi:N-acetylglutamate synthase-like GNAT family acetyltransferase
MKIIKLSEHGDMADSAAAWFHSKWKIPIELYKESIYSSYKNKKAVPQWYLALESDMIIGGLGCIDNDFHECKELSPNVCAVYVEEGFRRRGIAGKLLNYVCEDMHRSGIDTLYLVTDHTSFYERYGWEYLRMVKADGSPETARMYIHRFA